MKKAVYVALGAVIFVGVIAILVYGVFFASEPNAIPSALVGKPAAPFEVTTFSGEPISLSRFQGQPIILNFWASWCVSCRQEAHIIEQAYQDYRSQGVVFIGVAINDTRDASLAFIQRYGKTYLLAPDDESGTVSIDYGVTAVPETFFIDRSGIIANKILGPVNRQMIDDFLTTM